MNPAVGRRKSCSKRRFLLSGFSSREVKDLSSKIVSLEAVLLDQGCFQGIATHVICKKPCRSEKFLGACATGKWILTPDYIYESYAKRQWQDEEDHEWTTAKECQVRGIPEYVQLLPVPRRCRIDRESSGHGPFSGWRAAVRVKCKNSLLVYKRLLEHGGAEVTNGSLTFNLTHLFTEPDVKDLAIFRDHGVLCLLPIYLGDYLTQLPKPALDAYLLPNNYSPPAQLQSVPRRMLPNSASSSRCSSRSASPTSSQTSSQSGSTRSSRRLSRMLAAAKSGEDGSQTKPAQAKGVPVSSAANGGERAGARSVQVEAVESSNKPDQKGLCGSSVVGKEQLTKTSNSPTVHSKNPVVLAETPVKPADSRGRPNTRKNKLQVNVKQANALMNWLKTPPKPKTGMANTCTNRLRVEKSGGSMEIKEIIEISPKGQKMPNTRTSSSETAKATGRGTATKQKGHNESTGVWSTKDFVAHFSPVKTRNKAATASRLPHIDTPEKHEAFRNSQTARVNLCSSDISSEECLFRLSQGSTQNSRSSRSHTPIKSVDGLCHLSDSESEFDLLSSQSRRASQSSQLSLSSNKKLGSPGRRSRSSRKSTNLNIAPEAKSQNSEDVIRRPGGRPRKSILPSEQTIATADTCNVASKMPEQNIVKTSNSVVTSEPCVTIDVRAELPRRGRPRKSVVSSVPSTPAIVNESKTESQIVKVSEVCSKVPNDLPTARGQNSQTGDEVSKDARVVFTSHNDTPSCGTVDQRPQTATPGTGTGRGLKRKCSTELIPVREKLKKQKFSKQIPWLPMCHLRTWHPTDEIDQTKAVSLPMSITAINIMEGCLEDHCSRPFRILDLLKSWITVTRYPTAALLSAIIRQVLLKADSPQVACRTFSTLDWVLELHPPTEPALQKVYLFALREPGQDFQHRPEFIFLQKTISYSLVTDADCRQDQMNNYLLLKLLMKIFQRDFNHHCQSRLSYPSSKPSPPLLAQIMWPAGLKSMNHSCRDIIGALMDAIQMDSFPKKTELVQMLQSLVGMVASCLSMPSGVLQCPRLAELPVPACLFAREMAYRINADIEDNQTLQFILNSITVPWLSFKVAQTMLDLYDDSLLPIDLGETDSKLQSLKVLMDHYMYLVPPTNKSRCNSPHKKNSEIQSRALKTLEDDNQVVRNAAKKKLPSSLGSPSKCNTGVLQVPSAEKRPRKDETPMGAAMRKKIASINKRNPRGETPLQVACIKNNVNKVRELLQIPGIDVNLRDHAGWTALHEVCNHGHIECLHELLKYKPPRKITSYFKSDCNDVKKLDLHVSNEEGITPLLDSVVNNHLDITQLLLQYGGPSLVAVKTKSGESAFDMAVSEEMRDLLNEPIPPPLSNSSLMEASFSQDFDCSQCSQGPDCSQKRNSSLARPSNTTYNNVLDPEQTVSTSDCAKYTLLIFHLIRSYVKFFNLMDQASRQGADGQWAAPKVTEQDSKTVKHLKGYVEGFRKHLGKISGESDMAQRMKYLGPLTVLAESVL